MIFLLKNSMKNRYFINFIHGYFKSLQEFSLSENYHLHVFIGAKKAGYNKFFLIIREGMDILKEDSNLKILKDEYDIDILILDYKNIFNFYYLLLKFSLVSFKQGVLIYFNSHELETYLGLIFSKIFSFGKIKNVFMAHTQPKRGGLGNANLKQFLQDKILFKFFTDRIRLNNITEEEYLINNKVKKEKLFILPLVVDERIFTKVKDYKDRKDLLYFGQLSKKKNIPTILKALKEIHNNKNYDYVKLNIVGKETGYFLKEDLEILDIVNIVNKYGFVPLKDLNNILNNFLIYLNDSQDEGQCVAVFEAALSGCALCLPNIMSFKDVFKNKALFHEVGDYKKLSENIIYYLENPGLIKDHNEKNIKMIREEYNSNIIEEEMSTLFTFN